jgi:hypothetical protein
VLTCYKSWSCCIVMKRRSPYFRAWPGVSSAGEPESDGENSSVGGKNFGRLEKISRHWGIFPTALLDDSPVMWTMWKSYTQLCISEQRRWKLSRVLSDSWCIKDERYISERYISYKDSAFSYILLACSYKFSSSSYMLTYRCDISVIKTALLAVTDVSLRYVSYKIGVYSYILAACSYKFTLSSNIVIYRDDRNVGVCGKDVEKLYTIVYNCDLRYKAHLTWR